MDLYKFSPDPYPDLLEQGQPINGAKTVTWIERYRDPGEFTITAPVSSGLRDFLPLGTIISHMDTYDAMIVEDHEIDESKEDEEPLLTITGRSFTSWLENRCVGEDCPADGGSDEFLEDYVMAYDTSWQQASDLIMLQLDGVGIDLNDQLFWVEARAMQENLYGTSTPAERIIKRGVLLDRVNELLDIDGYGLRFVRGNAQIPTDDPLVNEIWVHNGVDKTDSVRFSYLNGDLKNAQYLWSNRNLKTHAYVVSTFNERRIFFPGDEAIISYDRRIMFVDASDLDSQYTDWPTGTDRDDILAAMEIRGLDALLNQKGVSITSTNVSAATNYQYRKHYNIGDLVTVEGNYDVTVVMRITEYVEFQDEKGESGYPTLSTFG